MMHAAAFLFAIASQIQAQSSSDRQVNATTGSNSPQPLPTAEVPEDSEMGDATATQLVTLQNIPAPNFAFRDSAPGPRHSQLATYMSCNDWSPNLWNGYACDRAAIAARISQHVDMQCKCFDGKCNLHSQAVGAGCGNYSSGGCTSGSCNAGIGMKVGNRYRQPMSTLHVAASDSCGATCAGKRAASKCITSSPGSGGSCGNNQTLGAIPTHPSSEIWVESQRAINPVRNRVKSPEISHKKGSFSILNPQPSNVAIR